MLRAAAEADGALLGDVVMVTRHGVKRQRPEINKQSCLFRMKGEEISNDVKCHVIYTFYQHKQSKKMAPKDIRCTLFKQEVKSFH